MIGWDEIKCFEHYDRMREDVLINISYKEWVGEARKVIKQSQGSWKTSI